MCGLERGAESSPLAGGIRGGGGLADHLLTDPESPRVDLLGPRSALDLSDPLGKNLAALEVVARLALATVQPPNLGVMLGQFGEQVA